MKLRSIVAIDPAGTNLQAACGSDADAILLTLVDAKHIISDLRERAVQAAAAAGGEGKRVLVLVNHPRTRLLHEDIEALSLAHIDGVLLPHTVEPQDVRDLAVTLREFELKDEVEPGKVAIFPVIDTARGLLRAAELAVAAPRVAGLVFDSAAYAHDIGGRDEAHGERLAYARGLVVAASRADDGQPLVRGGDLEFLTLTQYGFAGAIVSGASQVAAANMAFAPLPGAVDHARAIVETYDAARAEGGWVGRLGTDVVDAHTVRKARLLLDE